MNSPGRVKAEQTKNKNLELEIPQWLGVLAVLLEFESHFHD